MKKILYWLLAKGMTIDWLKDQSTFPRVRIRYMGITVAERTWNPLGNLWVGIDYKRPVPFWKKLWSKTLMK